MDLSAPIQDVARRQWRTPRRTVGVVAILVLVLGSAATLVLRATTSDATSSLDHLVISIAPPKDHLLAAERASDNGQGAIAAAVGSAGLERTRLLSQSISDAEVQAAEWGRYRAAPAGLRGEDALARRYIADEAKAQATSTAVLVPILTSTALRPLPPSEIAAHDAVRNDLIALHSLYRDADRALLASLERRTGDFSLDVGIAAGLAAALLLGITVIAMRSARRIEVDRALRLAAAQLTSFEGQLRRALELVDNDTAAFEVGERATREMLPDVRISVLVADSSRARLTAVAGAPACNVSTPDECPALRSGTAARFADSRALDACPTLAANTESPCSATCVPIAITARGSAIVHLSGPPGAPPDPDGVADLVARGVGDRVTLLQALATFQLQAARDPLTGLLNRRSLEDSVKPLLAEGTAYAVAFADLDHFKQLNDTHGHEAGDRALRAFARTLRDSVRPEDITCRWGGEEFVVVLPGCGTTLGIEAMDRVRTNLALAALAGNTAAVTASFGIAESLDGDSFDEVVEHADSALRRAKEAGRNRTIGYQPTAPPAVQPDPANTTA